MKNDPPESLITPTYCTVYPSELKIALMPIASFIFSSSKIVALFGEQRHAETKSSSIEILGLHSVVHGSIVTAAEKLLLLLVEDLLDNNDKDDSCSLAIDIYVTA